jgi:hypothetical protein
MQIRSADPYPVHTHQGGAIFRRLLGTIHRGKPARLLKDDV